MEEVGGKMKTIIVCVTSLLLVVSVGASARGYGHGYRHGGYGGYGNGNSNAAYLFGGVMLGTLLAAPRYAAPRYAPPPQVVYVPQPTTTVAVVRQVPVQATVSRRLLRDINGNCFERKIDQAGTELRIQLPAAECAW
jgi:hypothetical protein